MIIRKKRDLLSILFPRHCPLCDRVLKRREGMLCSSCRSRAAVTFLSFPGGFAPFPYRGIYRGSVRRFKYHGRPEYAGFYAEAIVRAGLPQIRQWKPDCLIPVPIHRSRMRERGYNQAEELARSLSGRIGVPCRTDLVCRCRNTLPQNSLRPEERKRNVHGAFRVKAGAAVPERILLVDDIFTTGSTAAELTAVLRARGAKEVHTVCVSVAL